MSSPDFRVSTFRGPTVCVVCMFLHYVLMSRQMTAVIASVEDSLGVPSPEEIAQQDTQVDQETCRLAEGEISANLMQ